MSAQALSFAERLQHLTQDAVTATPEAIGALVKDIVQSLKQNTLKAEKSLYNDFQEIAHYIQQTRNDLTSASGQADLPVATDELEAVLAATADATGKFLDAAEVIGTVAGELGECAHAETLNNAATMIYEASSFQDITGQRLTKVIKTLQQIEAKVASIAAQYPQAAGNARKADINDPQSLLNGPQLPSNASSQDDIDALFDSL